MSLDFEMINNAYLKSKNRINNARELCKRPLTLTEKILFSHLTEKAISEPIRGKSYVDLSPDRVAMQDATAQMALLQFMQAGKKEAYVPATIHCDHLIQAEKGSKDDLDTAKINNSEVYSFLKSIALKYKMGFWGPNSGIIHQIVFENYAFPGGMMIGTDSHTPNAGGLSMAGIGVGGADAVDVLVGIPWELKWPKIIGIKLTGSLKGWASPKDVILKLLDILTVKGGTGHIIEYFGEGTKSISTTGKSTISNMGAELGATTSIFPCDEKSIKYLKATNREDIALLAEKNIENLIADIEVVNSPEKYYDKIIEINLSELEPSIVGPYTPDLFRTISNFKEEAKAKNYPETLKVGLIGSCTNSSYEDLTKVASIIKDAKDKGLKAKSLMYVSPGSEQIRKTLRRDGILKILEDFGAIILSNSCGPCIGQWNRIDFKENIPNSIITSFNRNFKARNDGNPETLAFISSPELITAMIIKGEVTFNPEKDFIINDDGKEVKLSSPLGEELPKNGFCEASDILIQEKESKDIEISIDPNSKRLEKLEAFNEWNGCDSFDNCHLLLKIKGKCTTDHISPAGKWLQYRGHLNNISDNMFSGAVNSFNEKTGKGLNQLTGEKDKTFSETARYYKSNSKGWIVIGDENYGEGSSREHAAMEPRYLGCVGIIAKSFARIAENNLKKQGVFVGTFKNPKDYDKIQEEDTFSLKGFKTFASESVFELIITHKNKEEEIVLINHSFSKTQIEWFKAGSSLNFIKNQS